LSDVFLQIKLIIIIIKLPVWKLSKTRRFLFIEWPREIIFFNQWRVPRGRNDRRQLIGSLLEAARFAGKIV